MLPKGQPQTARPRVKSSPLHAPVDSSPELWEGSGSRSSSPQWGCQQQSTLVLAPCPSLPHSLAPSFLGTKTLTEQAQAEALLSGCPGQETGIPWDTQMPASHPLPMFAQLFLE